MSNLEVIAQAISNVKHALVCGHIMPDGDCLGSSLALAMLLQQLGKQATVAGPDPVPEIYKYLPGVQNYRTGSPPEGNYDTLVALDCPVLKRLGRGYRDLPQRDLTVINIDHHASSDPYGAYKYIDPQAAAVGEIIFDLASYMQVEISLDMAICLYTAIVTDTGSFQYESTTSDTHRRVARLIECGVPVSRISILLYEEKPRAARLLLNAALRTLSFSSCGQVAWMIITRDMFRETGANDEHAEGFVNYARSIKGVEVGLLFHELPDGKFKVSYRSKETVDVHRLAIFFGGGGHARAAGCEIAGDIDTIVAKVAAAAVQAVGGAVL